MANFDVVSSYGVLHEYLMGTSIALAYTEKFAALYDGAVFF